MTQTVVVVGAGVIGLSVAYALSVRGVAVTVLEPSSAAREASWAAGGILGVGSEATEDGPLYRLARVAWERWPTAADRIAKESGRFLDVTRDGSLLVATNDAETLALQARGAFHRATGLASLWLTGDEARRREAHLAQSVLGALHIPEGRLDNRALHAALETTCRRRGVEIVAGRASRLSVRGGRVAGVVTVEGPPSQGIEGDAVVMAVGAWSEALARTTGLALPVVPVKGQLVRLAAPDGFVRHVVKAGARYVVPHAGRGLVVGTTSEDAGFSHEVDASALADIESAAAALLPALSGLERVEAWAGLRPRLPDALPAIGPVRSRPGLHVATGHFRNGILLCEVTGDLVARGVLGDVDPSLAAFDPERFAPPARPLRP